MGGGLRRLQRRGGDLSFTSAPSRVALRSPRLQRGEESRIPGRLAQLSVSGVGVPAQKPGGRGARGRVRGGRGCAPGSSGAQSLDLEQTFSFRSPRVFSPSVPRSCSAGLSGMTENVCALGPAAGDVSGATHAVPRTRRRGHSSAAPRSPENSHTHPRTSS